MQTSPRIDGRQTRPWRHRVAVAVASAWLMIVVLSPTVWLRPWPDILLVTDFSCFWSAAQLIREGAGPALYDPEVQHGKELELRRTLASAPIIRDDPGYNPFPNPPPLALPYLALTWLPIDEAYLLWWVISLGSFAAGIALSLRRQPYGRSTAVIAMGFGSVTSTLLEGQPYGLMLLALAAGITLLRSHRKLAGGFVLGLLFLKPQYAVLLPVVLLLKRRWIELAGMAISGSLILLASLATVGLEGARNYLRLLGVIGDYGFADVHPWAMVNWRSLLIHMVPGLSDTVAELLVLMLSLGTVLLALWLWRGEWNPESPIFAQQMLALVAAEVLASPHSHIHGAALLLAPGLLAFSASKDGLPLEKARLLTMISGYVLFFLLWPVGDGRWLIAPFLAVALGIFATASWLSGRTFGGRPAEAPGRCLAGRS